MHKKEIKLNDQFYTFFVPQQCERDVCLRTGLRTSRQIIDFVQKRRIGISTVIDLGANIGVVSILLSLLLKSENLRIYSIEPHPSVFECLQKNIELYELQNTIHSFRLCIGSGYRYLMDRTIRRNSGASRVSETDGNIPVQAMTLDSFFDLNQILNVDIIKIDIEGSEYRVFSEFQMWDRLRYYHCEIHSPSHEDLNIFSKRINKDIIENPKNEFKKFFCSHTKENYGINI